MTGLLANGSDWRHSTTAKEMVANTKHHYSTIGQPNPPLPQGEDKDEADVIVFRQEDLLHPAWEILHLQTHGLKRKQPSLSRSLCSFPCQSCSGWLWSTFLQEKKS